MTLREKNLESFEFPRFTIITLKKDVSLYRGGESKIHYCIVHNCSY